MRLSDFKFKLSDDNIAQYPRLHAEDAKMLVLHKSTGRIEHRCVANMAEYFDESDLFVANNAKIFPARLYATKDKTLARIEVFLLRELNHDECYWDTLVEPARKIRIGNKLFFDDDNAIIGEIIDNTTARGRTIRFLSDFTPDELVQKLYDMGSTPLPPSIRRPMKESVQAEFKREYMLDDDTDINAFLKQLDANRYQSVFATEIGAVSVSAPALHISRNMLKRLELRGIDTATITVFNGLSSMQEIEVEDLSKHKSDSEQIILPPDVAERINKTKAAGHNVVAIGTEIFRAMEHVAGTNGLVKPYNGWTARFIYPPYDTLVADAALFNFYQPMSLQLLLVAAFGGYDFVMKAYKEAIKHDYRFGEYGDAMLIVP